MLNILKAKPHDLRECTHAFWASVSPLIRSYVLARGSQSQMMFLLATTFQIKNLIHKFCQQVSLLRYFSHLEMEGIYIVKALGRQIKLCHSSLVLLSEWKVLSSCNQLYLAVWQVVKFIIKNASNSMIIFKRGYVIPMFCVCPRRAHLLHSFS